MAGSSSTESMQNHYYLAGEPARRHWAVAMARKLWHRCAA
jgi:hypothetical protein